MPSKTPCAPICAPSKSSSFPVAPLAPPPVDETDLAALAANAAVDLFAERARAVWPTFDLDAAMAHDVAALCRALDGLPLAIELAAARSHVVPPAALLAQLRDRLRWLSDGLRDLPPRQRTIPDAIAWSYELLPPDVQRVFRLLTIFVIANAAALGRSPITRSRPRESSGPRGLG